MSEKPAHSLPLPHFFFVVVENVDANRMSWLRGEEGKKAVNTILGIKTPE